MRPTFQGSPLKFSYWVWGSAISSPAGSGVQPQPKSNLVHFSLKIWQLVATVLMILLRINWPVYQKIFLSKKSGVKIPCLTPRGSNPPLTYQFPHPTSLMTYYFLKTGVGIECLHCHWTVQTFQLLILDMWQMKNVLTEWRTKRCKENIGHNFKFTLKLQGAFYFRRHEVL